MLNVGFNPNTSVQKNNSTSAKSKPRQYNPSFGDSLLIIKPEVFHRSANILEKIKNKGFEIVEVSVRKLTSKEAKAHYKELELNSRKMLQEGNDFLVNVHKKVIKNMLKGNVTTAIIKGDDAVVAEFKNFVGATSYKKRDPKSLRGQIEKEMIQEWTKQGKNVDEIESLRDAYTFTHASDTNLFPGTNIKNYDYEIANLYPNHPIK